MALGLKCGGTLEERANRLFSTKGKKLSELDPSMFAKSKSGAGKGEKSAKESEKQKEVANLESQVKRWLSLFN
jgi:splicing factor 3A subunit 3